MVEFLSSSLSRFPIPDSICPDSLGHTEVRWSFEPDHARAVRNLVGLVQTFKPQVRVIYACIYIHTLCPLVGNMVETKSMWLRPFLNHIKAMERKRQKDLEKENAPNTPAPKVKSEPKSSRRSKWYRNRWAATKGGANTWNVPGQ